MVKISLAVLDDIHGSRESSHPIAPDSPSRPGANIMNDPHCCLPSVRSREISNIA